MVLIVAVVSGIIYLNSKKKAERNVNSRAVTVTPRVASPDSPDAAVSQEKSKRYELAKEITTPDGFINTDGKPITVNGLIGKKVILIDFWTYSCINCQRTTPYLNAWYEKYRDKGLVIIGVHTPEFEFEKDYQNVLDATKRLGIKYPVVLDNDYSTWTAYENRYWPRKYLIDIDGYVVYDHIGEGAYEETEKKIQELLEERETALGMNEEISKEISKPTGTLVVDSSKTRSPEIYFGASRNEHLGNGITGKRGSQIFTEPKTIAPGTLYLVGSWDIQDEFAENKDKNAKIIFRYEGQNVYMVATNPGFPLQALRDGKPLEPLDGGDDAKADRLYIGPEERLYHLIYDRSGWGEHTLEIIIENPGLRVFTFTFG